MSAIRADEAETIRRKFIAPIDEVELAVRMLEAGNGLRRPEGMTARQALACLLPGDDEWALAMARAALGYFQECIAAAQEPH